MKWDEMAAHNLMEMETFYVFSCLFTLNKPIKSFRILKLNHSPLAISLTKFYTFYITTYRSHVFIHSLVHVCMSVTLWILIPLGWLLLLRLPPH